MELEVHCHSTATTETVWPKRESHKMASAHQGMAFQSQNNHRYVYPQLHCAGGLGGLGGFGGLGGYGKLS